MKSKLMKYSFGNVILSVAKNPLLILNSEFCILNEPLMSFQRKLESIFFYLISYFSFFKIASSFRFVSFRMTLSHFFVCFIILIFLVTSKSYSTGTDFDNSHEVWANLRIGPALGDNYLNVMGSALDIAFQVKSHFFVSAYGMFAGDKFSENATFLNGTSGAEILDLGGLGGLFFLSDDFKFTLSLGLSHIRAKYDGGAYFNTLNFPLQTSAYYVGKRVGFGVTVFDNINPKIGFYGVTVGVQVRFN